MDRRVSIVCCPSKELKNVSNAPMLPELSIDTPCRPEFSPVSSRLWIVKAPPGLCREESAARFEIYGGQYGTYFGNS